VYSPYHQFKDYRDFNGKLIELGVDEYFLEGPFPPSYGKSKMGLKLTQEELENRLFLLDVWTRRVFLKYSLCSETIRKHIEDFFALRDPDPSINSDVIAQK